MKTIPAPGLARKLRIYAAVIAALLLFATPAGAAEASINWLRPSGGPYPFIKPQARLWIKVSLGEQKVFIVEGKSVVYTMVASTGLDSPADDRTPRGVFYVQRERGLSFYSAKVGEGGRYWVSWLGHGTYLFHSVPIDRHGKIIEAEARKLGRKASHGCIRLTLADARWIYEHIPEGTKVVIGP